jgi:hypothetical protein
MRRSRRHRDAEAWLDGDELARIMIVRRMRGCPQDAADRSPIPIAPEWKFFSGCEEMLSTQARCCNLRVSVLMMISAVQ